MFKHNVFAKIYFRPYDTANSDKFVARDADYY